MSKQMQTFIGFASLLAWLMTSEQLCVSSDATVYNGGLAIALCFAGACALRMLPRLQQLPYTRGLLPCTAISAVSGLVSALVQIEEIRLVLFCLQVTAFVPLLLSWGNYVGRLSQRRLFTLVIASACTAVIVVFALTAVVDAVASFALPLFALCSGITLAKVISNSGQTPLQDAASTPDADDVAQNEQVGSWALPALLCVSSCAASLFCGLAAMPYSANSLISSAWSSVVAFILLAIAAAGVWGIPIVRERAKDDSTQSAKGAEDAEAPDQDVSSLLQASLITTLAVLVFGALLLSLDLNNRLVISLGIIIAAKNCLLFLCWGLLPRYSAKGAEKPWLPYAALVLACGMFYLHYLGTWLAKTVGLRYWDLISASTVLIAFIALLAILYMALQIHLLVKAARHNVAQGGEQTPAAAHELTFEEVQEVISAHRMEVLEAHNLTEREREVIMMVIDGQTMGGIAEQLFITERTVKFHCKNGYTKLGVHNKKELMQMFSGM